MRLLKDPDFHDDVLGLGRLEHQDADEEEDETEE